MDKRVKFLKGKQREFLIESREDLKLTWPKFAAKLNINRTTLEKSYRFEYCNLPYKVFKNICNLRNISKNRLEIYKTQAIENISPINFRKVLGESKTKLPKINIKFKNEIPKFDTSKIKLNKFDLNKKLKFPNKLTPELAEEIGMHLGDGFLSNKRFEYRLKGDKKEKEYYDNFITPLYKKLFNVDLNIKKYETTYGFELYSKSFWEFKNKILGIPAGRKNDIELPNIIKVNDLKILTSFIRGIFDTDGNVNFRSNYGLKKYYPRIEIALIAKSLIKGIAEILEMLGLKPYTYEDKLGYWHITLNGYERIKRYSKLIGWSNPKHINKVKNWKRMYPKLGKETMVDVV